MWLMIRLIKVFTLLFYTLEGVSVKSQAQNLRFAHDCRPNTLPAMLE
jgi:hypothetical protein